MRRGRGKQWYFDLIIRTVLDDERKSSVTIQLQLVIDSRLLSLDGWESRRSRNMWDDGEGGQDFKLFFPSHESSSVHVTQHVIMWMSKKKGLFEIKCRYLNYRYAIRASNAVTAPKCVSNYNIIRLWVFFIFFYHSPSPSVGSEPRGTEWSFFFDKRTRSFDGYIFTSIDFECEICFFLTTHLPQPCIIGTVVKAAGAVERVRMKTEK